MNKKNTYWSRADEDRLLEMRATGMDWDFIAGFLGRTRRACEVRYSKLNCAKRSKVNAVDGVMPLLHVVHWLQQSVTWQRGAIALAAVVLMVIAGAV